MIPIDWISPLPPVRSGIADYSGDLIPHLAARCDLRLLHPRDQPVLPLFSERYRTTALEDAGNDGGRLRLYQMGNNRYHLKIFDAALAVPGLVVLHDYVLHHFHLGRAFESGRRSDRLVYLEELVRDHGWIGERVARPRLRHIHGNASAFALAANRTLLRSQKAILVHNSWARDRILEDEPELAVEEIPMAVPLPHPPNEGASRVFRQKHGMENATLVVGSFGFQTEIKRTTQALRALAQPGLETTHLLVVGEEAENLGLAAEARRAGVADRVHRLGYLPFDEFETAIGACDVCLCLRYPTAGETSAALLRVLALGRPALVSDYAQFAELPREAGLKIPIGDDESEALAEELKRLQMDLEYARYLGKRARDFVAKKHAPERAADALLAVAERYAVATPPGSKAAAPPPPTTLTWRRLAGSLRVERDSAPWLAGERRTLSIELENQGPARWLAADKGDGGVAIAWSWAGQPASTASDDAWRGLPHELAAGDSWRTTLTLRRPPGTTGLVVEPHVLGVGSFRVLGGPFWETELP